MYFRGYEASWPYIDIYYTFGYDGYDTVWDARKNYNAKIPGAFADGHVSKFGREKFVGYNYYSSDGPNEASTTAQFCQVYAAKNLDAFWGDAWGSN